MQIIATTIGKLTYFFLRLIGKNGATLPGLVVERLFPHYLPSMLEKLNNGVILVVGTNGKTTTTKMLSEVYGGQMRVLTNDTGSNFIRGINALLVKRASWSGKLPFDVAILELDEAYAAKFVNIYKPRGVVVLNVMRDQMDRFAEIDMTAQLLQQTVSAARDFVVLNKNDKRVEQLKKHTNAKVFFFGFNNKLAGIFVNDDDLYGAAEDTQKADVVDVELIGFTDSYVEYRHQKSTKKVKIANTTSYNALNGAAVLATSMAGGISFSDAANQLSSTTPAFGRGEVISLGQHTLVLQLVKNPGGFRQALISHQARRGLTLIAINDEYADGRDVSWLWDVDFEAYKSALSDVVTSGTRATDMALRLSYDDIKVTSIEKNLRTAVKNIVDESKKRNQDAIIYCTYTAMLDIRRQLYKYTDIKRVL
jgi:UDP-N-acetylmuramyl tripeptide synthase